VAFRIVGTDRLCDGLQNHGLARFGRRHDETALAFSDGGDQVHDAAGQFARAGFQAQPLLRVQRRQVGEIRALDGVLGIFRRAAVDRVQPHEVAELLAAVSLARATGGALDQVAGPQAVLAHLGGREVGVARARQVAVGPYECGFVVDVENARHCDRRDLLGGRRGDRPGLVDGGHGGPFTGIN
jgi:hypothetical protein